MANDTWHRFCVGQCGRNGASDPGESAEGSAYNDVRIEKVRGLPAGEFHAGCTAGESVIRIFASFWCLCTEVVHHWHEACNQFSESIKRFKNLE